MLRVTQPLTLDKINFKENAGSEWVVKISLPAYPVNTRSHGKSVFAKLSTNYNFVKHMMTELGIDKNDYLILRDFSDFSGVDDIVVAFNKKSQHLSSMAVLQWSKYAYAKTESNL